MTSIVVTSVVLLLPGTNNWTITQRNPIKPMTNSLISTVAIATTLFHTNIWRMIPANPVEGSIITNVEVTTRTVRETNYVPYIYRSDNWLLLPTAVPKTVTTNWADPIKIFDGYWSIASTGVFAGKLQSILRCGITSEGQIVWELK